MASLPNALPVTPSRKKSPGRAARGAEAEKCRPRTLTEIQQEYRSRTNYDRGTGYFVLFHALAEDLLRLSSGRVCDWLVMLVLQDLSIRGQGPSALPTESSALSVLEMAIRIGCDERSVNRALEYLQERKMAVVARLADSQFVITLLYREWSKIPKSYREWEEARRQAEEATADADDQVDDTQLAVKEGTVAITKAPVQVAAGQKSRSLPVTTGVKFLRIHWESKVIALTFSAVVTSGELVLTGNVPDATIAESNRHAKLNESATSGRSSGHGCPNGTKYPAKEGGPNPPKSAGIDPTSHPRAAELCELFDPLIYHHCKKTLSGDPVALQAACQAIGDTPHDTLVHDAVERAERRLLPGHVGPLCKEIAHNWKMGEKMPKKKSKYLTGDELKALIDEERRVRAENRRKL